MNKMYNNKMQATKFSTSNIKVFCRFRPFNDREKEFSANPVQKIMSTRHLTVKDPFKHEEISFLFDRVFDCSSCQQQIYEEVGDGVLNNVLDGFNGTIMAYGQTSSGKTYTMQGDNMKRSEQQGLIPRIIQNLFEGIENSPDNVQFKLKVSIFEIYQQKIRDLLDISKIDLKIRENKHGPYIEHLTEAYIGEKVQFYKIFHLGQKNRMTCATQMNAYSSRSHMIFLLTLNQLDTESSQSKTSKLFLVDLAGSEKVSKTGAQGMVLEEAKKINMSLASLGKVIKALSKKIPHIPYRDAKLTRIMKDSLGGNAKTTLIVTCSPHELHISETISSLRFGESAQKIKNKPKINRQMTAEQLQKIIQNLEAIVEHKNKWINILEGHIQNDLGKPLPLFSPKSNKVKQKISQDLHFSTTDYPTSKFSSQLEQSEQFLFFQKQGKSYFNLGKSLECPRNNHLFASSNFEDKYNFLEEELSMTKNNLKTELNKFYHLKRNYNQVQAKMKNILAENVHMQERHKLMIESIKQQILAKNQTFYEEVFNSFQSEFRMCTCNLLNESILRNQMEEKWKLFEEEIQAIQLMGEEEENMLSREKKGKSRRQARKISIVIPELDNSQNLLDSSVEENIPDRLIRIEGEYTQLLKEQSFWDVQQQMYKRQLKVKDRKIQNLQKILKQISEQTKLIMQQYDDPISLNCKIVKPIRGGTISMSMIM